LRAGHGLCQDVRGATDSAGPGRGSGLAESRGICEAFVATRDNDIRGWREEIGFGLERSEIDKERDPENAQTVRRGGKIREINASGLIGRRCVGKKGGRMDGLHGFGKTGLVHRMIGFLSIL
jgi:hypothetical protein